MDRNRLFVGFSRVKINPETGTLISGYFPMMDSYTEGGYEARSSRYGAGAAEMIIEKGVEMLDEIK